MAWANTTAEFGRTSRLLHWTMGLGILAMLALGLIMVRLPPGMTLVNALTWHKTIGALLLALVGLRLVWHQVSPPPPPLPGPGARAAKWGHMVLYLLMVAMPALGWVGSDATGGGTWVLGGWRLPQIAPTAPALSDAAFALHRACGWVLIVLISGHVAAALWHHWRRRDTTLRRMLRGDPT